MGLTTKLTINAIASLDTPLDLADSISNLNKTYLTSLLSGTAVGQADRVFHDQRTITASSAEDLDLAGALLDPVGGPFVLARIKGLVIQANAANVNNVVVGNTTNAISTLIGATHTITLRPGAVFAAFAGAADSTGYVVTAATADLLHVANGGSGTSVIYDVIIIGCSA